MTVTNNRKCSCIEYLINAYLEDFLTVSELIEHLSNLLDVDELYCDYLLTVLLEDYFSGYDKTLKSIAWWFKFHCDYHNHFR